MDAMLMRTTDVLRACGISKSTLRRLLSRGAFPVPRTLPDGRGWRWTQDQINDWLRALPAAK